MSEENQLKLEIVSSLIDTVNLTQNNRDYGNMYALAGAVYKTRRLIEEYKKSDSRDERICSLYNNFESLFKDIERSWKRIIISN